MPHIKSLDGVRAIAILPVVFFHLGLFPAGWIGVQIFFVLSGYLITGTLVRNNDAILGQYLRRFYWRRSLRIFPLYFGYLFLSAICFAVAFRQDWPWLVTYTANFARLRETDLADPFVHLWSLALEEQFYLVWPLVVFFLPQPSLRKVTIAILVLAPLCRLITYFAFRDESSDWIGRTIYALPSSQADAFAAGALLVLYKIRKPEKWFISLAIITAIAGAAVIAHQHLAYRSAIKWSFGYAMFLLQDGGFVWGYTLLNMTAALGIAATLKQPVQALEWAPLARIGVISYGIYVYHLPLLIALNTVDLGKMVLIPGFLALTYVISEVSFRYFESAFLRLKDNIRQEPWVERCASETAVEPRRPEI